MTLVVFQSSFDQDDFRSRVSLPEQRSAVIGGNIGGPHFPPERAGYETKLRTHGLGAMAEFRGRIPNALVAIADRIERCVREPAFYRRVRELCADRRAAFDFDWAEAWERSFLVLVAKGRDGPGLGGMK